MMHYAFRPVFTNLLRFVEHLTIKSLEKPFNFETNFLFGIKMDYFNFLGEHFKTTEGALVVPGAVVGNH